MVLSHEILSGSLQSCGFLFPLQTQPIPLSRRTFHIFRCYGSLHSVLMFINDYFWFCFNYAFQYLSLSQVCKRLEQPLTMHQNRTKLSLLNLPTPNALLFVLSLDRERSKATHHYPAMPVGRNTLAPNDGMAFHIKHLKIFSETSYFSPTPRNFL